MNRKITILLSLLLVSVLLALPVFASTGSGSAAASAATVKAEDTVEVVFSLQGFERLNALSVSFTVPEGLELEKAQWLVQGTISDVNTAKGQAVWTKEEPVDMTESTPVFKLTLKVLEPAAGTAELTYKVSFKSNVKMDAALLGTVSASASFELDTGCAHVLKEVAAKAPDCQKTGNRPYYVCEACGAVFAADKITETTVEKQTLAVTDHAYEEKWTTDGKNHWHVCKVCGVKADTAAHSGGTATCKDQAVCTVCQAAYGEPADHAYEEKWTTDGKNHWHVCEVCGEKADVAAHKMKWVVDQYPTETAAGKKHQLCEVCGYTSEAEKIEKLYHNPVLVEGKEPTCTEDGVLEHFYCSSCGNYFASDDGKVGQWIAKDALKAKATGHTYADSWVTDAKFHWHACQCGELSDKAEHVFELIGAKEATAEDPGYTGDEVCKVCAYVSKQGEVIPCPETEPATEPTTVPTETQAVQPVQPEEPAQEKGNPVLWIIPIVVAAAAAVAAPILIKRKRG